MTQSDIAVLQDCKMEITHLRQELRVQQAVTSTLDLIRTLLFTSPPMGQGMGIDPLYRFDNIIAREKEELATLQKQEASE